MSETSNEPRETTSTDDVRRVRETLAERFGNDTRALGDHATRVTEALIDQLGLRRDTGAKTTDGSLTPPAKSA
jgi:hypothetical protein